MEGLRRGPFFREAGRSQLKSDPVLCSGLFSTEQMEKHAVEMAAQHRTGRVRRRGRLLARLDENARVLFEYCRSFSTQDSVSATRRQISPAGEWLLDNYWLIEEQIVTARRHLPKGYVRELPCLVDGPSRGLPRAYHIALENISHGDGRVDSHCLERFVAAYQTVSPLTLGELWAIPIMLRIALIENLRRVSGRVMQAWQDQNLAAKWAEHLIKTAGRDRKSVLPIVASMAESGPPVTSAFVAEFARRLQGQGAVLSLPLNWLEEMLTESGLSIDYLVQLDTQQQAADQVSMSNCVTGLRLLSSLDWREFVEKASVVEKALRTDPAGVYGRMDFATRDKYRHVVENLAKKYSLSEDKVARLTVDLAEGAFRSKDDHDASHDSGHFSHVGFYLIDDGLRVLRVMLARERSARPKGESAELARKPVPSIKNKKSFHVFVYLGCIFLAPLLLAWPFGASIFKGGSGLLLAGLVLIPAYIVAGELVVRLVHWLTPLFVSPCFLPRLDYEKGIPEESRTLVVVPCIINSKEEIDELLAKLEVRYLANADAHMQFGLLTDFKDAEAETLEGDPALLERAEMGIAALNSRYPGKMVDTFFLCHRPRRWNDVEKIWMGYERKRGKLSEFNSLLHGTGYGRFLLIAGDTLMQKNAVMPVRYVITLDADTLLPRDSARLLVATMDHTLNRPIVSQDNGTVTSGYAIMQPRIGITAPSATRTLYARLFCNDVGVDPYTRNVSDLYQDLFGQGSFIGKGIYAVETFEQALGERFPENSILSHDLIEGCYARSGLVTDVVFFEDYPSTYSTDMMRRHRWIRGDWQLLPWIFSKVPTPEGREKNPLSVLSRWKIFDNLRRSLVSPALLTLLLLGWLFAPRPILWTLGLAGMMLAMPLFNILQTALRKPKNVPLKGLFIMLGDALGRQCLCTLFMAMWLPFEAFYNTDAIVRTLWRMKVSKRFLLQWNPSCEAERSSARTLWEYVRLMGFSPLASLSTALLLLVNPWQNPAAWFAAVPFLFLWLVSPLITWDMGRPKARAPFVPSKEQELFLRMLARKAWAFFDHHIGAKDNWLPPDNIQEQPGHVVAHRTSPTNMGLSLLSHLAAHDFGYLSTERLLDRLGRTLRSMSGMERYRNHFYNWYDTKTLQPQFPRYVSSVDSGNLAGHLMTLSVGLTRLADEPVLQRRAFLGLFDTALVLTGEIRKASLETADWNVIMETLREMLARGFSSLSEIADSLKGLTELVEVFHDSAPAEPGSEAAYWLDVLLVQCHDFNRTFEAALLPDLPGDEKALSLRTWRQLAALDPEEAPEGARERVKAVRGFASGLVDKADNLARLATDLASDMDFTFLYDDARGLLSIGYNVDDNLLDFSYYDLMASEARLTYFAAVALGQLPQKSWFALGRQFSGDPGAPVLLSWSGSMFEYLMPSLVMPSYEGTLLDATCRGAIMRQIEYGRQHGVPWGISESAYNVHDARLNYQYRAFGVPGLGLKRGLSEDMVVAPYASALALMFSPEEACQNLERLESMGLGGRYGLYESVDFTPVRLQRGQEFAIVYCFMAHHQGMSLLSLANALLGGPMQKRFLTHPLFQATRLLMEERMPRITSGYLHMCTDFSTQESRTGTPEESRFRVFMDPSGAPAVQLLSNGRYHVMVSSGGGGYSRFNDMAVTRWNEDLTCDDLGMFCYVRDLGSDEFWSVTHQPTRKPTEFYEAVFSDARAEFRVRKMGIDTHMEMAVSPEDNIELRRINVMNHNHVRHFVELTTYAEVVLASPLEDSQHPAFSKLFVETEIHEPLQAVICSRRPRYSGEAERHMFHLLNAHGASAHSISYETDRSRFIGRGRSLANPIVMDSSAEGSGELSGSQGAVLDPIASVRCRFVLGPGQTITIDLVTGVAPTKTGCLELAAKFRERHLTDRVFNLAWTHSQVLLHHLNATVYDAQLYEEMASAIFYPVAALRAAPGVISANVRGLPALWGQSISGDLPIVLLKISDASKTGIVAKMVKAHAYWHLKGLDVDLVICNEGPASYRQNLVELVLSLVPAGTETNVLDRPGGIFIKSAQQMSMEDRVLIEAEASLVLSDLKGSLSGQLYRRRAAISLPKSCPLRESFPPAVRENHVEELSSHKPELLFDNGYGGFTMDGREYHITIKDDDGMPPAPWVNVLSNRDFGSVVSEGGSAYTWKENAHEFRLTPWKNDPVRDNCGEALYLRDETSGHFWSPTPLPRRGKGEYTVRHGFGYSVFSHNERGIKSELWVYVARNAPVKFSVLKLYNASGAECRLSAVGYVEWVLGDLRSKTARHIVTQADSPAGALFARNAHTLDFPGRVAVFDLNQRLERTMTGDRTEFIGREGSLSEPAGLKRVCLSGRTGSALDPCGAIQTTFTLKEGESHELVFILGAADNMDDAVSLAQNHASVTVAAAELTAVMEHWRELLGRIRVQTPDPSINFLANGWLMYQSISCRFQARSGFYQSSGAIGFRDQLQDSMAILHAAPLEVRGHLLLCASRQFPEGDVQHWWHPPSGRGVRTRYSDDYLWLPLAVERYVSVTGDAGILKESVGYIEARPLNEGEKSSYDLPIQSQLTETLYEHCVRAIRHGLRRGERRLPLMGGGDWNDGMDRVGMQGRGESVWLGFFLYYVLNRFSDLATLHEDQDFAGLCGTEAASLREALENNGWDGAWYRRAYFDDGTPLGSAQNDECRIDSLPQSWSVISKAAPLYRRQQAMQSVDEQLVRRDMGLIKLFAPPFDKSALEPGYVKGYVPGVRENGGQYTHAAVWVVMAFFALGDKEKAWELLRMINPVLHGDEPEKIMRYKVEPYVVSADVYALSQHEGRGGWSWYTGAAGWMYTLIMESLLGLRVRGEILFFEPVLPAGWEEFTMRYRHVDTRYEITVRPAAVGESGRVVIDGVEQDSREITLRNDKTVHHVEVFYQERVAAEDS